MYKQCPLQYSVSVSWTISLWVCLQHLLAALGCLGAASVMIPVAEEAALMKQQLQWCPQAAPRFFLQTVL